MLKENLALSVAIFNPEQKKLRHVYEYISTFEEAHLLSILAMNYKNEDQHELVVILPGWNLRLNEDEIRRAKELAEKYKAETN